jgi:hypothetical protein
MSWRAIATFLVLSALGSLGADCGPQRPPRPAGRAPGVVTSVTGAALVARIAPDGSDARAALRFQDEDWDAALDVEWSGLVEFEPWIDTAGGDTPWDALSGIARSGDGVVVVGPTGLGVGTAARAARLKVSAGANPALLVTASPYCVARLTATGHPSTADPCAD